MSLPWPDLTTAQWYEEIAKLKKKDSRSPDDSSIIDLGGPGSGNFGHVGRPGEVGGSGDGDGDGNDGDRGAGTGVHERVKKDGGTISFVPSVLFAPVTAEDTARVFGSQSLEDVTAKMIEDLPGDFTATWKAGADTLKTALKVTLKRDDGLEIARRFTREADGSLTVWHDLMEVPKDEQGKGTAKTLLRTSFELYQQLGVDRVKLTANLDVGGYAWAKFGFKASEPRKMANEMVADIYRRMPDSPEKTALVSLIEAHDDDPRLPWHVAGLTTADGRKIGRDLLTKTDWRAELRLKDDESMTRLQHYITGQP